MCTSGCATISLVALIDSNKKQAYVCIKWKLYCYVLLRQVWHLIVGCRMIAAAYAEDNTCLGSAISLPINVLANNGAPDGPATIDLNMDITSSWEGWAIPEPSPSPPIAYEQPSSRHHSHDLSGAPIKGGSSPRLFIARLFSCSWHVNQFLCPFLLGTSNRVSEEHKGCLK